MKYKVNEQRDTDLLTQILLNRGVKDPYSYLHLTSAVWKDPAEVPYIKEAVECILEHKSSNDLAVVIVDSDCDGYTSASTLINYLNDIGYNNIEYYVHEKKEHGIDMSFLERFPNTRLLLVPDAGSNDYEQHRILKEKRIDVVVIDHHECPRRSEDAIVVNNQLDNFTTKSLSGVGMVYKVCKYMDSLLNVNYADYYLDLVANGLLADVMSMVDEETKYLVNEGLKVKNNAFFDTVYKKQRYFLGNKIYAIGIVWFVSPYINAVNRSGSLENRKLLFEAMLNKNKNVLIPSTKQGHKGEMESLIEQAWRMCTNVKRKQGDTKDKLAEALDNIIQENKLYEDKVIIVKNTTTLPVDGLTGLVAMKITNMYGHPSILLNPVMMEDGLHWAGSARSVGEVDLRELCESSGLVDYAAGHSQAFGISVPDSKLQELVDYLNDTLKNETFEASYTVDKVYSKYELSSALVMSMANYEDLWANDVKEPLFLLKDFTIPRENIRLMGERKNTINIDLGNGVEAIKFFSNEDNYKTLTEFSAVTLDIIGTFNKNEWNGNVKPQVKIKDYEIKKAQEWYF